MKSINILAIFLLFTFSSFSQNRNLFEKQWFIKGTDTLPVRILYPQNMDTHKKYPVVIFLHGSGERGNDNEAQLVWGADMFLDSMVRSTYPAIVVFPQCTSKSKWSEYTKSSTTDSTGYIWQPDQKILEPLQLVSLYLDSLMKQPNVDTKKIYVGGLSMGGFATWELLWRKPDVFAAAFPICGAGDPAKIPMYKHKLPTWIFHGEKDNVIPVSNSRLFYSILKQKNRRVKYNEYAGIGHDSWKNAFAEQEFLPWLFSQKSK